MTDECVDDKKGKFIESASDNCLYCDSWDVVGASINIESGKAVQNVSCSECEGEFTLIYTLSDVIPR